MLERARTLTSKQYGLFNSDSYVYLTGYSMRADHRNLAIISKQIRHDGHVSWLESAIYRTFCKLNTYYFPFDSQRCPFEFGSSSYGSVDEAISGFSNQADKTEFVSNGDWEVCVFMAYN